MKYMHTTWWLTRHNNHKIYKIFLKSYPECDFHMKKQTCSSLIVWVFEFFLNSLILKLFQKQNGDSDSTYI